MAKTVQLDANGYRKFGIRDKLAYAAGDLGCNMSFALKGSPFSGLSTCRFLWRLWLS